jgi:hypothetical protein
MQVTPIDPARMTEATKRYLSKFHEMKQTRRHIILLSKIPEIPTSERPTDVPKCSAQTLEGRKCTYKATNGCFCRKHFLMK